MATCDCIEMGYACCAVCDVDVADLYEPTLEELEGGESDYAQMCEDARWEGFETPEFDG